MVSGLLSIVLLVHVCVNNGYYLSPNKLTFDEADHFCIHQCDSNLASFINESHYEDALNTINDSYNQITNSDANNWIWIGLQNPFLVNNTWSDVTPFIFGSNLTEGVFPWIENRTIEDQCVNIDIPSQRSTTSDCSEHYTVLCNHCDGILNKYLLDSADSEDRNQPRSVTVAEELCNSYNYNSTLASFHSQSDFEQLNTLCDVLNV